MLVSKKNVSVFFGVALFDSGYMYASFCAGCDVRGVLFALQIIVQRLGTLAIFVVLQGGDNDLDIKTRLPSHTAHCCDGRRSSWKVP